MRSRRSAGQPASRAGLRCAIYTRKSSEEGLEQAFNSLDAQREACEAYLRSQRHEGWTLLPARYDDGGLSGGSLNRPALQRLLAAFSVVRASAHKVLLVSNPQRRLCPNWLAPSWSGSTRFELVRFAGFATPS